MAETMLRDVGSYKNKIIVALLQNADIMECLLGKNYTEDDVDTIVYKQIFPYLYVDDTQTEAKAYIGIEIDIRKNGRMLKNGKIYIWAYSHKSIMKYSKKGYIGTRTDILSDMIERAMRNIDLGIGETSLEDVKYFSPTNEYYGRVLIYDIPDFKIKDK